MCMVEAILNYVISSAYASSLVLLDGAVMPQSLSLSVVNERIRIVIENSEKCLIEGVTPRAK